MSQSKLQQFYTVRKRFHTEHAITSAKRRKTDPNLDIPAVGAGCEDGSFAATSQETPTPSSQETPTPSSQETPTPSSQETPTPSASTSAVEDTHRPRYHNHRSYVLCGTLFAVQYIVCESTFKLQRLFTRYWYYVTEFEKRDIIANNEFDIHAHLVTPDN